MEPRFDPATRPHHLDRAYVEKRLDDLEVRVETLENMLEAVRLNRGLTNPHTVPK